MLTLKTVGSHANLFEATKKHTSTTSMTSFLCVWCYLRTGFTHCSVFIANFEEVTVNFGKTIIQSKQGFTWSNSTMKHQNNEWNLLEVNNKNIDVVLVYLLLTLNRFVILFWYSHCSLWTSNCRLGSVLLLKTLLFVLRIQDQSQIRLHQSLGRFLQYLLTQQLFYQFLHLVWLEVLSQRYVAEGLAAKLNIMVWLSFHQLQVQGYQPRV